MRRNSWYRAAMTRLAAGGAVVGFLLTAGSASAAPKTGEPAYFPMLRVPQLAQAPAMDGRLDPAEWSGAAAFTGVAGNPLGKPFMLPEAQQVIWYLGFHGDMLYIGMRSPHPKGTFPVGRVKDNDDMNVLWGDHTEIQILTNARAEAGKPGKGFYKMMSNAWAATQDVHYWNGTPGTEDFWSMGGTTKCYVTDSVWELEMSVKAQNIKLPQYDGRTCVMQLVRAADTGGIYYAGWVGKPWMNWDDFAQVDFDASAPAFQFLKTGEIMEGNLDTVVAITGTGTQPQSVEVTVAVEDAAGKPLFQEKQTVVVKAGERRELALRKTGLAVTEVDIEGGRNAFEISAVWQDGKNQKVLYRNRSPFMKMTQAWRAKYWDPWVAARPQSGEWDAVFAYLPYSHMAQAKVDVDFFGMPDKIRGATRFAVDLREQGKTAVLAKAETDMVKGAGETLFETPDLPDGTYEAVFRLFGADGQAAGEKVAGFVRKRFPFEHNQLGLSNEVIPPFVPLAVNPERPVLFGGGPAEKYSVKKPAGDAIFAWGRMYALSAGGLFEQILTTPPTGAAGRVEALLAAPLRWELAAGGKPVAVEDAGSRVAKAQAHRVDVEGKSQAGNLGLAVSAFTEYDGWYQVELTLTPQGSAAVDSLDFVADLRDTPGDRTNPPFAADTLYVQRMGGGVDNTYQGDIPRKPGVCYQSSELWPVGARTGPADIPKAWKSFVPVCFIGNGDRGLWFFAWSDKGWQISDKDSMLRVERLADGTARLRVRLLAGPVVLDKPRKLQFALQAAPIKANDVKYRTRVEEIAHDTSGYRYYGDSVDSFVLNTDAEYAELRKFLLYGTERQENGGDPRYAHWGGRLGKMLREGSATRVMLYGSQWMTGLAAEEFDSFAGEWLGRSNWKPDADLKFNGRWNYGHTVQWKTPRQMTAARVNWPKSMLDFFVWYHDRLIAKAGINGTWWDNCYAGPVTEYDPELGRLDAQWNLLNRRELCKRLNVVGWEHLRPPCWSMNTEVEMSWCQVYWLVEGFWAPSTKDISTIDHFGSLGFFRAALRPKSTCMIPSTSYMQHYRGTTPESDRKMMRSSDGLLLLHDVQPVFDKELVRRMQYTLEYDNPRACLLLGYWASAPFVIPAARGVVASVYQNPTRKTGLMVFFNTEKKDQYLGGTTFSPAGVVATPSGVPAEAERPVNVKKVYDFESGEPVKVGFRDGNLVIDEPLIVGGHEYRLLAVEAQ